MSKHFNKLFYEHPSSKEEENELSLGVTKAKEMSFVKISPQQIDQDKQLQSEARIDLMLLKLQQKPIPVAQDEVQDPPQSTDADSLGEISLRNKKNFSEAALHYRQITAIKNYSSKNRSQNQTLDLLELNHNHCEQSYERVTLNCSTERDSISCDLTSDPDEFYSSLLSREDWILSHEDGTNGGSSSGQTPQRLALESVFPTQGNADQERERASLTQAQNLQISRSSASGDHNGKSFDNSDILDAFLLRAQAEIAQVYRQKALSLCDLEKWSQAIEYCRQLITMNPKSIEADQLWNRMLQQRTKLLESQPTSTTLPSQNLSPSVRLKLAIERYSYQALLNPDSAIVQTNLGKLYHKNRQWQEAISCYRKAIAIDINYSPAHQYLAQAVKQNKQSSCSEVNKKPNQLDFYFKLAQTKIQEGRLKEAQICYQQVIKSEPSNWKAYYRMGNLLAHHRQWEKALDSYQKVLQFKDDFSWAYNNAGNVCLALKRWQEAKDYYQSAIKINPYFSWSYCNLGEAASQMKQWDQALSAYHQAQQLQPEIREINQKIKNAANQLTVNNK